MQALHIAETGKLYSTVQSSFEYQKVAQRTMDNLHV